MENKVEFITTQKGGRQLILNGYVFYKESQRKDRIYWLCTEYTKSKCNARAITVGSEVQGKNEHNHMPDQTNIIIRKTLTELKRKAIEDQGESSGSVLRDVCGNLPTHITAQLPAEKLMQRTIIRTKQVKENLPPALMLFKDVVIPDVFKLTAKGENFYHATIEMNSEKILIFSTAANFEHLARSKKWQSDATFKICPQPFYQFYTVHGTINDKIIPLIYVLMPKKTEEAYKIVYSKIKETAPESNPETIIMDYESAQIGGFSTVYRETRVQGCFFHFTQSVWRKIQKLGLGTKYTEDSCYQFNIKKLFALAFVQENYVIDFYEHLIDSDYYKNHEEDNTNLLDYFENTWIGQLTRSGNRRRPKYQIQLWNCYQATLDNTPRTNNTLEGWHSHLNKNFSIHNPNLWHFLKNLKIEEQHLEFRLSQTLSLANQGPKRRKYRDYESKLIQIVQDFNVENKENYLNTVACNLKC
ncbi:uncharacterized protein [Ambystoma mexicanum]|uniref:uncharacterized protein n=1 Tax=Ambystoma mexicanum TaxID=8296 RepID=UPI0037E7E675